MLIKRTSVLTGVQREKDLPITQEELDRWNNGELIQNVFGHLSEDDREFLMTGITPEEWEGLPDA